MTFISRNVGLTRLIYLVKIVLFTLSPSKCYAFNKDIFRKLQNRSIVDAIASDSGKNSIRFSPAVSAFTLYHISKTGDSESEARNFIKPINISIHLLTYKHLLRGQSLKVLLNVSIIDGKMPFTHRNQVYNIAFLNTINLVKLLHTKSLSLKAGPLIGFSMFGPSNEDPDTEQPAKFAFGSEDWKNDLKDLILRPFGKANLQNQGLMHQFVAPSRRFVTGLQGQVTLNKLVYIDVLYYVVNAGRVKEDELKESIGATGFAVAPTIESLCNLLSKSSHLTVSINVSPIDLFYNN